MASKSMPPWLQKAKTNTDTEDASVPPGKKKKKKLSPAQEKAIKNRMKKNNDGNKHS